MENRITEILGIQTPIISGGMVWCSGWELASAVSNAGGLGLIGSGSMTPEILREHVRKCKQATSKPFGVNLPLMYDDASRANVIIEEGVQVVFTSAGNPKTWTSTFKEHGIKVVHVVSNTTFAKKAEAAGVDAIVAEGFEAGGHNGKEETTTMVLIPLICKSVNIPVIAAGGISSAESVAAAFALGASGVQIGTRFALSKESSASTEFKNRCISLKEGETMLCMKSAGAVRMVKNSIFETINSAEYHGASKEQLIEIAGRGRAKRGIFEGDINEGFIEIGQVCSDVSTIESVSDIFLDIKTKYNQTIKSLKTI